MLFSKKCYLGIDPTEGNRSIAYAALDEDLKLIALGQGEQAEVLAFMGGQQEAVLAMHGPLNTNNGLMRQESIRQKLTPPPKPGRDEDLKLAEYLIAARHLPIYTTPFQREAAKPWQRLSLELSQQLSKLGFGNSEKAMLETCADACFQVWLGHSPFKQRSLIGQLQRQLVLYDLGINLPNPMSYFEELTRYKILQGVLPKDVLYKDTELRALAVAFIAWASQHQADSIETLGDAAEGFILLPKASMYTFNMKASFPE